MFTGFLETTILKDLWDNMVSIIKKAPDEKVWVWVWVLPGGDRECPDIPHHHRVRLDRVVRVVLRTVTYPPHVQTISSALCAGGAVRSGLTNPTKIVLPRDLWGQAQHVFRPCNLA